MTDGLGRRLGAGRSLAARPVRLVSWTDPVRGSVNAQGATTMDSLKDKASGAVDEATGKGKDAAGQATGDRRTEAEGKGDQALGKGKQGMADAKDQAGDLMDQGKEKLGS